jgi:hypothetical protein
MKRVILLVVILSLALAGMVYSQGLSQKGIKAGLNIANMTGDNMEDAKRKNVYAAGVFAVLDLNENVALRPEVLYSLKGAKMEESEEGYNFKMTINLTYIDIPVLLQYVLPTSGSIKPQLFAGPSIGLLMGAKMKMEAGGEEEEEDIKDDVKSMDIGLVFGVGISITNNISIDVRYSMGMTNISDMEDDDDAGTVKNKVISAMLGISL